MKLHLFQSKEQIEDRVEIYYKEMTPVIQKVIDVIHDDYPVLKSKEDDEISENGCRDFFVSFTVFYAIGAVVFYISTYLETKKMNELLKDIQTSEAKKR